MRDNQETLNFEPSNLEQTTQRVVLGMTFENDEARREHFLKLLAEKLEDPEFRRTPGFPKATDDDILRLSDPPYFTACPNPFLAQVVEEWVRGSKVQGSRFKVGDEGPSNLEPSTLNSRGDDYRREPFAVDVSVGKTDQLYKAHGYHTKVPHLAIVPSILHYTRPGDIVLDGFCGSGMTGVAAQWCGTAPDVYRRKLEDEWRKTGHPKPEWGARRVILGDLGPAATFIAANYNIPFDVDAFAKAAQRILDEVADELGWMYRTVPADGVRGEFKVQGSRFKVEGDIAEQWAEAVENGTEEELRRLARDPRLGRINYTVWSEVFSCPECSGEVVFLEEALDKETKRVHDEFPCPSCGARLTKKKLERLYETSFDAAIGATVKKPKRRPVFINYSVGKAKYEKPLDDADREILKRVEAMPLPPEVPTEKLPYMHMTHERARMDHAGITHLHHFFLPRAAQALAALWRKASAVQDGRLRNMLLFFVEQAIWGMSVLNRYKTIMHGRTTSSNVNQYLSGVYYVPSQHSEVSPWYNLANRLRRLCTHAFVQPYAREATAVVTTGDCASIPIPNDCIDYIFTDPPFGENIYYADLNFLVESWHRVLTDAEPEAIVDRAKKKSTVDYQDLMRRCFEEYHRVLKPGRWMTVVFSNSKNSIWRAIQEAMGMAGFVVADVRTLDKKQGSYRQVTSSAVKQDLVISAYKPTEALAERFKLGSATVDSVWAFVSEHLRNVPVFVGRAGEDAEIISERTPQMLHDRMIAFFVQRRVAVPISGPDFFAGLDARYPRRDGMVFLPDQVAEYDRKRTTVSELRQLELFVTDEASAVQWVRQQLQRKPQTFQELQPQFMQQIHAWAKHEKTIELKEILELNFFRYDGHGPIPPQIVSWLRQSKSHREAIEAAVQSSRFKVQEDGSLLPTLNLEPSNLEPVLRAAEGRWYVPDPKKEGDLERLRLRTLLREFEDYKTSPKRKIKQFRTEAVRAGFKHCYDQQDYQTIVDVAAKLPEKVIQEDEKLLMYYDVATMRLGME